VMARRPAPELAQGNVWLVSGVAREAPGRLGGGP